MAKRAGAFLRNGGFVRCVVLRPPQECPRHFFQADLERVGIDRNTRVDYVGKVCLVLSSGVELIDLQLPEGKR